MSDLNKYYRHYKKIKRIIKIEEWIIKILGKQVKKHADVCRSIMDEW